MRGEGGKAHIIAYILQPKKEKEVGANKKREEYQYLRAHRDMDVGARLSPPRCINRYRRNTAEG